MRAGGVNETLRKKNRGMKFLTKRHTGIIMSKVMASRNHDDADRFGV